MTYPDLSTEAAVGGDVQFIAGLDEAGRGPLAGPVTAACVVFDKKYKNSKINDSKKLSEKRREELYDEICRESLSYSIVSVGPRRIDAMNIRAASLYAMKLCADRVIKQLAICGSDIHFLIDGNALMPGRYSQEYVIKGDSKVLSIGAASILAKVTRDRLMQVLDNRYPHYGLATHKGYPTKMHRKAVQTLGPSPVHRTTFAGVREVAKTSLN